jgi:tyrosinase
VDWPKSQEELQNVVDTGEPTTILANTSTCGWPHHLLLPKGTEKGMVYDLVVMITPAEGSDIFNYRGWTHCGLKNKTYPDSKPMGYPWDRRPNMSVTYLQDFVSKVPNMITTQIVITHLDM